MSLCFNFYHSQIKSLKLFKFIETVWSMTTSITMTENPTIILENTKNQETILLWPPVRLLKTKTQSFFIIYQFWFLRERDLLFIISKYHLIHFKCNYVFVLLNINIVYTHRSDHSSILSIICIRKLIILEHIIT